MRATTARALLVAAALVAGLGGRGCEPAPETGGWDLTGCNCDVPSGDTSVLARCGDTVCVDGRRVECVEGERHDRGPCSGGTDGGTGPGPGPGRTDAGTPDGGACPAGGGTCRRNTFVPCDPLLPELPCRAQVCVPSGQGPDAGCLSPEGYFCDRYPCVPGLVCGPDEMCQRPEECDDACDAAGAHDCAADQQPVTCRADANGCLRWDNDPPCRAATRCEGGTCHPYCSVADEPCGQGERCEDAAEGCVSTGLGFSPAGGFCEAHGDCAQPGARCAANLCMPHCAQDDDCLLAGIAGCCHAPSGYGVCRTAAQGPCGP